MISRKLSENDFTSFEGAINFHMEVIDELLALEGVALTTRPLRASLMFVRDFILAIDGDTKDNPADKPWFAVIYHHIVSWYRSTYGEAFQRKGENAYGVIAIRRHPVELRVPLTVSRVEVPGETAWLYFPRGIMDQEDPLSWLVSPPNLDKLDTQQRQEALCDAGQVAIGLRLAQIGLGFRKARHQETSGLLSGVRADLESAASHLLSQEDRGRGAALWSLQMAVERTLKAVACERLGAFEVGHDLFKLFDRVSEHLVGVDRELLKKLPNSRQVMKDRYGLDETPTLFEVIAAYHGAVKIVTECLLSLNPFSHGREFGLLLKKPPWTTLPSNLEGPAH